MRGISFLKAATQHLINSDILQDSDTWSCFNPHEKVRDVFVNQIDCWLLKAVTQKINETFSSLILCHSFQLFSMGSSLWRCDTQTTFSKHFVNQIHLKITQSKYIPVVLFFSLRSAVNCKTMCCFISFNTKLALLIWESPFYQFYNALHCITRENCYTTSLLQYLHQLDFRNTHV